MTAEAQLVWYWAFGSGAFGAFTLRFVTLLRSKKRKLKAREIANGLFGMQDILYYFIGGGLSTFLSPTTPIQAFVFGAIWEAVFNRLVGKKDE